MKIRTRLAVAFIIITVFPMLMIYLSVIALSDYQEKSFKEAYGLTEQIELLNGNSLQVFNRLTRQSQKDIRKVLDENPDNYKDPAYLDKVNAKLNEQYAYLIVRREDTIIYYGANGEPQDASLCAQLPDFDVMKGRMEGGIYLDGESQHLIKQMDFQFSDGAEGSVFIVSNVDDLLPEVKSMFREMLFLGVAILVVAGKQMDFQFSDGAEGSVFIVSNVDDLLPEVKSMFREMLFLGVAILVVAGFTLTVWVYRSILSPLNKLQEATKQIRDGNLEFTLDVDADDEIGQLCQDFEEMRIRLKENAEEKLQYDKESKELISNISHDLKTPITAIKGYVEGILDGVASSPEKLDRYIRTIYNKANDMDRLIDELTFYSKIDTNKIPYTFAKINVSQYFKDCLEEVGLDMEARGIELGYFNYADEDVMVIADAEQMKRVILQMQSR